MEPVCDYEALVADLMPAGTSALVNLTGSQRVGLINWLKKRNGDKFAASFHQLPAADGKKGWKAVHAEAIPYVVTLTIKQPLTVASKGGGKP